MNYATIAGDLWVCTEIEAPKPVTCALLIEFESAEALRTAIKTGSCTFEFGGKPDEAKAENRREVS